MTLSILIYALIIAALFQPNAPRFFAAVVFISLTLSHELFLAHLDGFQYYGSAALFDLAIIIITSGVDPIPRMVISLQKICIVSILCNLGGWLIWDAGAPPTVYNAAFIGIFMWALITFIKKDRADVGGFTMDSWSACFRVYTRAWVAYCNNHKGAA